MQTKIKFLIATVALALLFSPITVSAKNDNVYIVDDANLLSTEEYNRLEEYLDSLNPDLKYVAVTTSSGENGYNPDSRLEYYYTSKYSNYDDGIAFIIDMYDREIYMSGYGDMAKKLSSGDAYDITDNVYTYASDGDYYNCIYRAFYQANTEVNEGLIIRPMRIIVALLISIILGFLGTFIFAIVQRADMKPSIDSSDLIFMAGASLVGSAAVYDSRRVRRQSSSSGHSGGGFSGGGGGFSGGGGGHSGGGHSGGGHSF